MGEASLGVLEAVSIALGGMIGGGIYAVLGVVAGIAGGATWAAFVLAGVVALCAGYSFVVLNAIDDQHAGGAVSFVERFVGNTTVAGMVGWTILFGYVGSMAMYAFAFGEFAVGLSTVPDAVGGMGLRPIVSVLAVVAFLGVNLGGARATGQAENVLVSVKIVVLVLFGTAGVVYLLGPSSAPLTLGLDRLASFGPVTAAAVSFVAFQGWQLLFYDQARFEDPEITVRRAVYVAIVVAVAIYALVAVTTVGLAPDALVRRPHTALANAAGNLAAPLGFREAGAVIIALSALVSTGSAINATLFSTGYFAKNLLSENLLPDQLGEAEATGVPTRTLLCLGVVTAGLTAIGSLGAITAFSSLTFIVVFGVVSLLALRERHRDRVWILPPALGVIGSFGFFPLMLYHLYRSEPETFLAVIALAAGSLVVELLYFEREELVAETVAFEQRLEGR